MTRRTVAFNFPLDDHSVNSGLAGLDVTALPPEDTRWWTGNESSTMKERSRARAEAARKRERTTQRLITLGISLVTIAVGAMLFYLRQ